MWTDDVRYFGTEVMRKEYENDIAKKIKVKFLGVPKEFVGVEFLQDLYRGLCELKAPKYWEDAAVKFEHLFPKGMKPRVNAITEADDRLMEEEVSDKEVEESRHLPYRGLCGVVGYPAACSKLEMRYAITVCGKFRGRWGAKQFKVLTKVFEYGYATRETGIIYSKGLDEHGVNTIY